MNIDELAQKTFAPDAASEDKERLFTAVFSLDQWHFIADGAAPRCSLFPAMFGDQPAVVVFTDAERATRYLAENGPDYSSASSLLSVSTANVVDYLERLIPHGIVKIFFNPDRKSLGFYNDLKMMRPIYEYLESKGLLLKKAENQREEFTRNQTIVTLIVQIKDGLGFPSGFVKASDETQSLFCRVPSDWTEGEQLKPAYLEKIYAQLYGANWRAGNSDGSSYRILYSHTKIFSPETVKTTNFSGTVNQDKHQFYFYLGDKYDHLRKVTAEEFQADIDAEMRQEEPNQLNKLLEENADVIAQFDSENELFSAMMAGTAASMDDASAEDRERIVSDTAEIFKSLRAEYDMSPKLFRVYIESCLQERKLLMPVLAFAFLQQDKTRWAKLAQDSEFINDYAVWMTKKLIPGAGFLMN